MKIGMIGCGNMGEALLAGFLQNPNLKKEDLMIYVRSEQRKEELKLQYQIECRPYVELMECDAMIIAVKSPQYEMVCKELAPHISKDTIVISITTPQTLATLASWFSEGQKIVRVMPNTPTKVLAGTCALVCNAYCEQHDRDQMRSLFQSVGSVVELEEHQMGAFIALAGSSPAYFFHMLEVMGDAGVQLGLSRKQSLEIATQTMLGSALLQQETKQHPTLLKEAICSPKGTTIEALRVLEQKGFASALWEAMIACGSKQ